MGFEPMILISKTSALDRARRYPNKINWYPKQDLNLRPTAYQAAALPLSYPGIFGGGRRSARLNYRALSYHPTFSIT